jgi:2-polyprenyl-3-methyl-5-hydroxy-6-metoxy-1,4-benzoquinol methylase
MSCPICLEDVKTRLIESYTDTVSGQTYNIYSCSKCEVVFSDPMKLPSPDWYQKAFPYRDIEEPMKTLWCYDEFLKKDTLPRGKLLDIACGLGSFLLLAKKAGYKVSGFDFDERVIKRVKESGIENVEAKSFEEYYREKNDKVFFDVITMFGILEHVENPPDFIDKIKKLLRPEGHLLIVVPNDARLLTFIRELHDYPPNHFTRWDTPSLTNFLNNKNFRILKTKDSRISLYCIKINLYSLILKTVLSKAYKSGYAKEKEEKGIVSRKYYRLLRRIYLIVITPIALIFWFYSKLFKPHSGSEVYVLAQLK